MVRKVFLPLLLSLLLFSPLLFMNTSTHIPVLTATATSKEECVGNSFKDSLVAYRGEFFNFSVLVLNLNGTPTANVRVRFRDEGCNLDILYAWSNQSGYANLDWLISKTYRLGPTVITATPLMRLANGSWVPDPNHTVVPSSVNVTILSRTCLEALSYPQTLVQGELYYATFYLTDNLKNPMVGCPVRLYLDDVILAAGPTNESGMITLPFIVPAVSSGTHNLVAKYFGNNTHAPATLMIQVEVVGQENPLIIGVSLNKSVVKPSSPVKITVQTNETASAVTLNGTSMSRISDNLWETIIVAPQIQGNHTLQVCAVGNNEKHIVNVYLYVDATPPKVTIHMSNPTPKPGEQVEIIVEVTDETEVVMVKLNGTELNKQGDAWRETLTLPMEEGVYVFIVTALDKAGNIASASITCRVASSPSNIGVPSDGGLPLGGILGLSSLLSMSFFGEKGDATGDQLFLVGTFAFCAALLLFVFKRPRRLEIMDDFVSFDVPPGSDIEFTL